MRTRSIALGLLAIAAWTGASRAQAPPLLPADAETVLQAVKQPGARAVLVNVWATWCAPCIEEFPDVLKLKKAWADKGLRVILVSADFPETRDATLKFLVEHGVDFPTYLKDGNDMKFIDALSPKWTGAIPATFLYDSTGRLVHVREGMASYDVLEREVQAVLKKETS